MQVKHTVEDEHVTQFDIRVEQAVHLLDLTAKEVLLQAVQTVVDVQVRQFDRGVEHSTHLLELIT